MEYQKIINLLEVTHINLEQEFGLKWMMSHEERIMLTVTIKLKFENKVKFM